MPRIYFNARFLTQPLSGMQRYAQEMLSALDLEVAQHPDLLAAELIALAPRNCLRLPAWQTIRVRSVGVLPGHAWEQLELPWFARDGMLVSLAGSGPYVHGRHVLALHDANVFAHPELFTRTYGAWHRRLRPRLARAATALITVSEFSKCELARYCAVPIDKFTVLPDSAEHILKIKSDVGILDRWQLLPKRYALTVGNQSPNKNLAFAVTAFLQAAIPGVQLVIAGGGAEQIFPTVRLAANPAIKPVGRVSDAELKALYENAAALLFPSIYEGFGVPPLEALVLGCPVIASHTEAVREVLGNAAVYYSSLDQFAALLGQAFAASPTVPSACIEQLQQHYSWRTSAQGLAQLLARKAYVCSSTQPNLTLPN